MSSNRFVVNIEGVNVPRFFSEECFVSALHFNPKPGDIFIVTYPKCGTTWMQNLVLNILRRGKSFDNPRDFYLASPFLDQLGSDDSEKMMIRPGAYKTHLPLNKVPWSEKVKYIYVARNPKDCCTSFYHHMKVLPGYQFADGTFDEFLDMYIKGDIEFGNYFDHLLPWYNLRNNPNVFFTTFENMKNDLKQVAMDVAEFINKGEAEYLKDNPDVLEKILHNCSFEEMKKMINEALSSLYNVEDKNVLEDLPKGRKHIIAFTASLPKRQDVKVNFIRKGEIGAWKSELTATQKEVLNREIDEKTKDTDVMSLWKRYIVVDTAMRRICQENTSLEEYGILVGQHI